MTVLPDNKNHGKVGDALAEGADSDLARI